MSALRVLLTHARLDGRTGSELHLRDVATGLLARGHTPVVYSPVLGALASGLRAATVPVVDHLDALGVPPDVIHGHHHLETLTALLRFPSVPAVSVCHAGLQWHESPPMFPRIRRWVAVDEVCRDRLVLEHGVPAERVHRLLDGVDLERFAPRPPLPPRPARALVLRDAGEGTPVPVVREACARAGLALDVAALDAAPEAILGGYDVVFAGGRGALMALAVGTAVVLCDARGAGPLVTADELDRLRAHDFGPRALGAPLGAEHLVAQLRRYDSEDAARVSHRVRAEAGRDAVVDELVGIYREAIAEQVAAPPVDVAVEVRAAAESLRRLSGVLSAHVAAYAQRAGELDLRCARLDAEMCTVRAESARVAAEATAARAEAAAASSDRASVAAAARELRTAYETLAEARDGIARELAVRQEMRALHASRPLRLRDRLGALFGRRRRGTTRLRPV
jgi:hypothetical protein